MDLIHKLSVAALIILTTVTAALLVQHQLISQRLTGQSGSQKGALQKSYNLIIANNRATYSEVIELSRQKKLPQAMEKLQGIITAHPDNPMSSVYLAQLQYQQGKIAEAIHSYRMAVDREPDFVDQKTPLFLGSEIMDLITEARGILKREQKLKPNDTGISLALEDMYYLQRRIAGGCE
jgi:predicted Zn-dependent protease